jgi:hypothetical protein
MIQKTTTKKQFHSAGHWWLMPVILATQEAEIRKIGFKASPGKWFMRPNLEKHFTKIGLAQGEDPEFKPQYRKKKKNPPFVLQMLN